MDILHKVAIANVIVNNFDDIIPITGNHIDKEVLIDLIKQEETELDKMFDSLPENKKDDELHRADRFQHEVLDLLEELLFVLKEK